MHTVLMYLKYIPLNALCEVIMKSSTKQQYSFLDDLILFNYGAIFVCSMFVLLHGVCRVAKYLHDHGILN